MKAEQTRSLQQPAPVRSQARAFAWSLAVHVVVVGLLFVGLKWTESEKPLSVAGPVIEASLVIDPDAVKAPPASKPKPKPKPPKPKPPAPKPEPTPPEPDPVEDPTPPRAEDPRDQQLVDELGLLEQEELEREQEEMRRREQIELEAIERMERERREQDRARERDEQIEDIERERREAEERRMEDLLEQERAEQSEAQPRPGNEGVDESLLAQYAMALSQVIETNWTRPDTVPLGMKCKIVIIQAPGGEVVGARVDPSCPYDDIGRRSLEAAVMRASPLPYDGFEDVFNPQLNLTFTPDDRY